MPTPAIRKRSRPRSARGSACRCSTPSRTRVDRRRRGRGGPVSPAVSVRGAEQILRPPTAGLPHLRGELVEQQTLEGGDVLIRDGRIAGPVVDEVPALVVDAQGCSVIPGL